MLKTGCARSPEDARGIEWGRLSTGREVPVFFFYNSRWGCMTSLLVSAALTLLLLFLLGWI